MVKIVLSEDQVELLLSAREPVWVVDRSGLKLGQLLPSATTTTHDSETAVALQRIEDAKHGGDFRTTDQVLQRLQTAGNS